MSFKKILLLTASILFIVLFFSTDFYSDWLESKVLNAFGFSPTATDWDQFEFQVRHLGIEERRSARLGSTYSFCQDLKEYLKGKGDTNALVLLPPNEFTKAEKVDAIMPEPIVFYYECGIKGAWTTSANVNKCTWAVIPYNREVIPVKITSQEQLDTIINQFNKYHY
jgi:hypothetical protein